MRKISLFALVLLCAGLLTVGCTKKKTPLDPTDEVITMAPTSAYLLNVNGSVTNFDLVDGAGEIWIKFTVASGTTYSVETFPLNDVDVNASFYPVNSSGETIDLMMFVFSSAPVADLSASTFETTYLSDSNYVADNDDKSVSTYSSLLGGTADDNLFSQVSFTSSFSGTAWVCITAYNKDDSNAGMFRMNVTSP